MILLFNPRIFAQTQSPAPAPKASGGDVGALVKDLDYPELQVVPRASERLKMEAKDEDSGWFVTHWTIEVAGLATAFTGFQGKSELRESLTEAQKSDAASVATLTQAVGLGWFAAGIILGLQRPYRAGMNSIAKVSGKDERSVLLRERLAEEALEKPTRYIRPIQVAAVVTNLGMNFLMGSYMTDKGRLTAGVAATLSLLPFMIEDATILTWDKHREYKKKIYGPLSSTSFGYDEKGKTFYPMANFLWTF